MLGVPQAITNYKKKSTKGLSVSLIGSWFLGDAFKTIYFVINGSPAQFLFCGLFQITMDTVILYQIYTYKQ